MNNPRRSSQANLEIRERCSWCNQSPEHMFPSVFCWTKMQAEAGQPLEMIIARKELERVAGGGVFFWGIGNSLRPRIKELIRHTSEPKIFFSPMRSKPKIADHSPNTVVCWTEYLDLDGRRHALPPYALVLSRGNTPRGMKAKHYALVCRSDEPLSMKRMGAIDTGHCHNWRSANHLVGTSQVSAVLEHHHSEVRNTQYEVVIRAALVAPFFVTLVNPVLVTPDWKQTLDALPEILPSARDWMSLVSQLRHSCKPSSSTPETF